MNSTIRSAALTLLLISGCKDAREAASNAVAAATGSTSSDETPNASGATAETENSEEAASSATTKPAAKTGLGALADGINQMGQAMKKMGQVASSGKVLGKVVNWRALQAFLPDKLGAFSATKPLRGSTGGFGNMQTTQVERRYASENAKLRVKIMDTSMVPMLRAAFSMANMVNEDSSEGLKKGVKVQGSPGLLEWQAKGRSKLSMLVAERFVVELRLSQANTAKDVLALGESFDVSGLSKVKVPKADAPQSDENEATK